MPIRRTLFLCVVLLFTPDLHATIQAGMQWDVRTTGSDNNGGGFDPTVTSPGTDYSQQNSAQQAYTDIVIGSTTTQITSSSHPFGSTSPGNVINITGGSGCTTGHFEIISVSGTTATMDRSVGTAASTCTGNLGGSLQTMTAFILNNPSFPAGNIVHVKSGTYTVLNQELLPGPVTFRGYQTTHNDYGTRPLWTTSANSSQMLGCGASWVQTNNVFDNINFSSTNVSPNKFLLGNGGSCYGVTIMNSTISGFSVAISGDGNAGTSPMNSLIFINVEFSGMTTAIDNDGGMLLQGCNLHGQTSYGILVGTGAADGAVVLSVSDTVISGAGTYGIYMQRLFHLMLDHVTIANSGSDGIRYASGQTPGVSSNLYTSITNSIFYGNGGYGINLVSTGGVLSGTFYNAYGGNTSGARNNLSAGVGDITLTASPFNNSSGGDFSLNNTAGGGAALRAAGFPGAMSGGTMTGYADVGALQHQGASSVTVGYAQ